MQFGLAMLLDHVDLLKIILFPREILKIKLLVIKCAKTPTTSSQHHHPCTHTPAYAQGQVGGTPRYTEKSYTQKANPNKRVTPKQVIHAPMQ